MKPKAHWTRRRLLAVAGAAPVAVPLLAQEGAAASKPASREEDLKSARDTIAANATALAKVKVPTEVEPAFVFRP